MPGLQRKIRRAKTFRKLSSKQQQKPPEPTGEDCPVCGKALVLRQGAYGEFVSCSGYPKVQIHQAEPD